MGARNAMQVQVQVIYKYPKYPIVRAACGAPVFTAEAQPWRWHLYSVRVPEYLVRTLRSMGYGIIANVAVQTITSLFT